MTAAAVIEATLMADIGDAIRHQLHALADRPDPTPPPTLPSFSTAPAAVLRLRESLMQEVHNAGTA